MKKYWVMKTFKDWWDTFQKKSVIGIDEDGVDKDYTTFPQAEIITLIGDTTNNFGEYHNRVFQEFCKWMQVDDLVIIGTGQTTDFNIAGIVRVSGNHFFSPTAVPRHLRDVEIMKVFAPEISMRRFMRTPRLERIDEADFHESLISIL